MVGAFMGESLGLKPRVPYIRSIGCCSLRQHFLVVLINLFLNEKASLNCSKEAGAWRMNNERGTPRYNLKFERRI
jgi:hypothetical protein